MSYSKDPIKANLIQYLKTLDVSKNKEETLNKLIAQLERDDYIISNLTERKGITAAEVEQETAIYIQKVLQALFAPEAEPRAISKPSQAP